MAEKAPKGSMTELLISTVRTRFPGLVLVSGYRKGAITVTGKPSMHGLEPGGHAVDLPPDRAVFEWIKTNYGPVTFELIHSPMGAEQIYKGQSHVYTGAVKATHYDHVHWSVAEENRGRLGAPASGSDTVPTGFKLPGVGAAASVIPGFDELNNFFGQQHGGRRLALIGAGIGLILVGVPLVLSSNSSVRGVVSGVVG